MRPESMWVLGMHRPHTTAPTVPTLHTAPGHTCNAYFPQSVHTTHSPVLYTQYPWPPCTWTNSTQACLYLSTHTTQRTPYRSPYAGTQAHHTGTQDPQASVYIHTHRLQDVHKQHPSINTSETSIKHRGPQRTYPAPTTSTVPILYKQYPNIHTTVHPHITQGPTQSTPIYTQPIANTFLLSLHPKLHFRENQPPLSHTPLAQAQEDTVGH